SLSASGGLGLSQLSEVSALLIAVHSCKAERVGCLISFWDLSVSRLIPLESYTKPTGSSRRTTRGRGFRINATQQKSRFWLGRSLGMARLECTGRAAPSSGDSPAPRWQNSSLRPGRTTPP